MNYLSKPLIFIGSGRSGTTIISEIIFRHEELAWPSTFQDKFPSFTAINLLRNLFDNKLWQLHGQKPQLNKVSKFNKLFFKPSEAYFFWEHITGEQINFSRSFLLDDRASKNDSENIRAVFEKLVALQNRKRLAFKITGPSRIGYLTSIFPDAIFINITREPLPTIDSWLKVDFWQDKGKNQLWWTGAYTDEEITWAKENADKPSLLAALQYKKINDVTRDEIERFKVPCLTIRYEDFVEDAEQCIESIMRFTQLKPSVAIKRYLQQNKIYNQNKKAISGYSDEELVQINNILEGSFNYA